MSYVSDYVIIHYGRIGGVRMLYTHDRIHNIVNLSIETPDEQVQVILADVIWARTARAFPRNSNSSRTETKNSNTSKRKVSRSDGEDRQRLLCQRYSGICSSCHSSPVVHAQVADDV